MNFNVSKGYVNSAEVYGSLNDIYFANRSMQASDNFNAKASELDTLCLESYLNKMEMQMH
jgi:hypothetical protein